MESVARGRSLAINLHKFSRVSILFRDGGEIPYIVEDYSEIFPVLHRIGEPSCSINEGVDGGRGAEKGRECASVCM